jgi:hypothetical protein
MLLLDWQNWIHSQENRLCCVKLYTSIVMGLKLSQQQGYTNFSRLVYN